MRSASILLATCMACDGRLAGAQQQEGPAASRRAESGSSEQPRAARSAPAATRIRDAVPQRALDTVDLDSLCVTSGRLTGGRVEVPTFRAVAPGHGGDAAAIKFLIRGETNEQRALESGQLRRQLGLKLRAQDSCNLVYVMWRLDPKPSVEVSIKRNAGARSSKDCGADGYKKVKPKLRVLPPAITDGRAHELRAEIEGDDLTAWIDGNVVWQGGLPGSAGQLSGPAGTRSDNLELQLLELRVDASTPADVVTPCAPLDQAD